MKKQCTVIAAWLLLIGTISGCTSPTDEAPVASVSDAIVTEPPVVEPAPVEPSKVESAAPAAAEEAPAPAEETTAPATPAADVYALSPDSYIGFAGSKSAAGVTIGTHYGQFLKFDGTVTVPGGDVEKAKVELNIQTDGLQTDNSILTNTIKGENFFEVEKHPTATFSSTSIAKSGDGYTVTGNLTIRGIAKGVSFPVAITVAGDTLTATSEFSLDRKAWGLGDGWTQSIINDDVLMQLEVEAKKSAAGGAGDAPAKMESGAAGSDPFSQPREGSEPKKTP